MSFSQVLLGVQSHLNPLSVYMLLVVIFFMGGLRHKLRILPYLDMGLFDQLAYLVVLLSRCYSTQPVGILLLVSSLTSILSWLYN